MVGRWIAAHKSLVFSATSGTVIAAVVATTAILSGGYTAQRMDLGDGAVWVVNGTDRAIGRASTQVLELNSVISAQGTDLEVVQRGGEVLLVDHTNASLDVIDPATSAAGESIALPPQQPEVFLSGADVVIVAQGTGEVWVLPKTELDGFDPATPATLSFGADSVLTVDPDGILYAYSPEQQEVARVDLPAGARQVDTRWLVDLPTGDDYQITAVGGRWAVLAETARRLAMDGVDVALGDRIAAAATVRLQVPAAVGDGVLVAHDGGLISVGLDDGTVDDLVVDTTGAPAAPAVVGDCVFAAWTGAGSWQSCAGAAPRELDLEGLSATATLEFAVNGDQVVLNDARSGATWAVQQNGELIDNWQELIKIDETRQEVQDEDEDNPTPLEEQQQPPVAVDDEFGARPGKSSVLPVLLNDYDANGDVLVIDSVQGIQDSLGRVEIINQRQQLQITLNASAGGAISFGYTISDGRGGTASATVVVTVRGEGENSPPQQVRTSKTTVAEGGTVTTQVLGDWIDPDGDAFYLAAASSAVDGDLVSAKPDGTVLFVDAGGSQVPKSVALAVSDGTDTGTGSLTVTVRARGSVPIIVDPFVVQAYTDEEITVEPLEHVRGGNDTIRLNAVPPKTGVTITPSFERGTFTFASSQARTHYIDFVVTDGDQTVTGSVRIDVTAPPEPNAMPITIPKTVFVRTLGSQSVDVAGTDIDPAGGVLLVTEVTDIPAGSGVRAEVLEQRSVRVTLLQTLDAPVTFNYRVSNGLAEATGSITVIEIPQLAQWQPPIARPDTITVRVGDVVDIPVLANDEQPDGEEIALDPQLVTEPDAGLLFAAVDQLRYLAPRTVGNYTAAYRIISTVDGQVGEAEVHIQVRERNAATNVAPVPAPVVARVLAGETVRIQIPLTGIDPDGDSVQLLGVSGNPERGTVLSFGSDWIEYKAGPYSTGTDSFGYSIQDSLGARATGSIRVGIAARVEGGRNPVAVDDVVSVRPSRPVTIQVLTNDSDPDGGTLTVDSVRSNGGDLAPTVVDERFVQVTTPATPGTYGLVYQISNQFQGTASAFVQLVVADSAPLSRPIATDSVLSVSDVIGRTTVDVPVLDNVFFADGEVSSLRLALVAGYGDDASVLGDGRIRVTVRDESQVIPFSVSHPEDPAVRAYAFIRVPGLDEALPQLDRSARPISVVSEESVRINLNDYVVAIGGSRVQLADRGSVRATHANGDELVVDEDTLVYTSAPRYFGPASISFEVTDGEPGDPDARTATLSLPIEVQPRTNQPPVFNGVTLSLEPGEQRDIDLLRLTTYPEDDLAELVYTALAPQPTGFSVQVNGQRLLITADEAAVKGTTTSATIGVADSVNQGTAGRITLQVVPSTRPIARPVPDTAIARRGQTTQVDVLANDDATNPFPGEPLRVLQVRGLDGTTVPEGVRLSASADNSRIQVEVAATAPAGDVNLQYQVADATGDPERYAWGAVRISVQDRPDPVSSVRVTEFGDRLLRLAWNPGQFNNSPITGYTVTMTSAADGRVLGTTACTASSGCALTTPGNGPDNAVRLSVVATNAIGTSDAASYSAAIWSDIIPASPDNLSWTPLNGGLRVTWTKPASVGAGSPITYYVVRVGTASNTFTVSADDPVGKAYSFSVTGGAANGSSTAYGVSARNSAPNSLATWNEATGTGIPAGPPLRIGTPTASASSSSTADISWAGSFDPNGRAITNYWAVAYSGAAPTCTVTGVGAGAPSVTPPQSNGTTKVVGVAAPTTRAVLSGLAANTNYNLVVFAYNQQGCEVTSPVPVILREIPGDISSFGVTALPQPNGNGTWDFHFTGFTIASGSRDADLIQYQLLGEVDGSIQPPVGPTAAITSPRGEQYGKLISVQVRACKQYPELPGPLCSANWTGPVTVGVPVDTRLTNPQAVLNPPGELLEPRTLTWSWTGWPSGEYDSAQYSCDDGATWTPFDSAHTSCTATQTNPLNPIDPQFPKLQVVVAANGTTLPPMEYQWR